MWTGDFANTTLSPVTVQRFVALRGELIGLVELDYAGFSPKLEQIIRAFEFTQIELAVYRDRGYAQRRAFEEFATSELIQRVHARMIKATMGKQLIGHISRNSTATEARESIVKKEKTEVAKTKPKNKHGRPAKDEVRPAPWSAKAARHWRK